jgi:hypothetical protein
MVYTIYVDTTAAEQPVRNPLHVLTHVVQRSSLTIRGSAGPVSLEPMRSAKSDFCWQLAIDTQQLNCEPETLPGR